MALNITSSATNAVLGANASIRDLRVTIDVELVEATSIRTNPDPKNRVLQSSVAISELTVIVVNKSFSSVVNLDDSILIDLTRNVPLFDPITLAESLAITTQYGLTDVGLLSDEVATQLTKPLTSAALALSDEQTTHFTKTISDALAITETFFNVGFWVTRTLSDTAILSDAINVVGVNDQVIPDQTTVSDAVDTALSKSLGDGFGFSDAVAITSGYGRLFTDSLACSDTFYMALNKNIQLSDSFMLFESTVFSGSAVQLSSPANTFSFNSIPINGSLLGNPMYDTTILGDDLNISIISGSVLARSPFNTTQLG